MDKWEVLRKNLQDRVDWCNHVLPHLQLINSTYYHVFAKRKASEQLLLLMKELDSRG